MTTPDIGDPAPDLRGESTEGTLGLDDFRGRWAVVYFYPKSFTSGCTTEACDFRDALPGMDAAVVGVAPDPVDELRRFREAYGLPFPLVSDEDLSLAKAYGAYGTRTRDGEEVSGVLRSTFVIDPEGRIAAAMVGVSSQGHVEQVERELERARG